MTYKKDQLIPVVYGDCCGSKFIGLYKALQDFIFVDLDKEGEVVEAVDRLLQGGFITEVEYKTLYFYENISCGIPLFRNEE